MPQKQNKVLSTLGLAHRAGKLVLGTQQVRDSVKKKRALLVITACDISQNTRKEIFDSCAFYGVQAISSDFTMSDFSEALGKLCSVSAVALTDIGFKNLVINSLEHQEV
jgi:ribosomal protein L7Ae-like RNA K-turn-binding protein